MVEKDKNKLLPRSKARVLFVDMNSFFASCEQQDNYYLRERPVAVCVYTGQFGCVIAPSIEAKRFGIKTGMRLNEAMLLCKDLVPVETHPDRYRSYHIKIMDVLRTYSEHVYPKSIDEAVVDLTNYELIHKDPVLVAKAIKQDITEKVGDWLKCSIGIAPNSFLAKVASDIHKPDGLTIITPENIDDIFSKLKLTDLAGIAKNTAERLKLGGVHSPLQMRHTSAENLRAIFKSILGFHWYCRLNFIEADLDNEHDYKTMQAMRHLNKEQRASNESIHELLVALCLTLERRMVKRRIFANTLSFYFRYANGEYWDDHLNLSSPIQDGADIYTAVISRIQEFEKQTRGVVIHRGIISISLSVSRFMDHTMVQYNLFEDHSKKDHLRKVVYNLKDKFGKQKLMRAVELKEGEIIQDVIGFGSVKDLYNDEQTELIV
ncbi:MAG: DNA polymerase IV [Bacteroidetes bacterium]|nr:DNA polymerase IV [Bacteroidota bacterium]